MNRFLLFFVAIFMFLPVSMAQVTTTNTRSTGSSQSSISIDASTEPEDDYTKAKSRITFTKRELSKLSDPRIKDLYWYALNDTTDRNRYLRAHYAFNGWSDNWSFELHGGVQGVAMNAIKERFSLGPQLEVAFRKDLHPYWAVRFDGYFSDYEHDLYTPHLSTMTKDVSQWTGADQWMTVDYSTLGLRGAVMLNMVNLFAGREMLYTPWLAYAYGGAGFAYAFHKFGERDGSCLVPQWFFGIQGGWNFNQRLSLVMDANLSWQGDDLQGFTTQNSTWKAGLTVGLAYKFSKKIHFQRLGFDESFVKRQVLDASDDGEGDLQTIVEKQPQNRISQSIVPPEMIEAAFFQIDRIELQHVYVLNLGFYAELIKAHPDQKFIVKGFADLEVGPVKRNLWLSEQRAKVVADVLVKTYGVNPDQLVVGGGDLDYDIPFLREQGHHRFNRCTIVCPLTQDYKIIKETEFEDKTELMDGRPIK